MLCIGIEGTAHTLGVGVVELRDGGCRILSNVIDAYRPENGGIHPREAANHHAAQAPLAIGRATAEAGICMDDIGLVAFSQGPGLGPCLRTAATAARALALSLKTPVIGVNHCVAHLEIGCATTGCKNPVLLYVSGGNTQVLAFANHRYRVFGETLDIGLGNMLDKFGREAGFGFPAGGEIERLASASSADRYIMLPYSVKGMDVSFSGMLTACVNLYKKGVSLPDLCFSIQETSFAMLAEVTERAMAHLDREDVLLGGGVACNSRLRAMVGEMAGERGAELFVPEKNLCVDNGAMIAWLGLLMHDSGVRMRIEDTVIDQKFRTDEVDVRWR